MKKPDFPWWQWADVFKRFSRMSKEWNGAPGLFDQVSFMSFQLLTVFIVSGLHFFFGNSKYLNENFNICCRMQSICWVAFCTRLITFFSCCVAVAQSLSCVWLFATPWTATLQAPLSSTICWSCSDSCPLSQWCYLTISSSATPSSFFLRSFPASRSFPMSQFFPSCGQVLELQLQPQSFQCIFRVDFL